MEQNSPNYRDVILNLKPTDMLLPNDIQKLDKMSVIPLENTDSNGRTAFSKIIGTILRLDLCKLVSFYLFRALTPFNFDQKMKYFLPCPFLSRTQSVSASSYRSVFN